MEMETLIIMIMLKHDMHTIPEWTHPLWNILIPFVVGQSEE